MLSLRRNRTSLPTGLEIDSGTVRAVRVDLADPRLIVHEAHAAIPRDVVRGGEVVDPDALGAVLDELFTANPQLSRSVRVGLANSKVVVRSIDLPPIDDAKQLAAAVAFHASDELPMPIETVVIDHVPLGRVETPEGPRERVVLVAARRDMLDLHLRALRAARLRPVGLDLAGFAMVRALVGEADGEEPTVYVSAGALTNVAVAVGRACRFTRVVGYGLANLVDELSARHDLLPDEVDQLVRTIGLSDDEHVGLDPRLVSDVRRTLEQGARVIGADIRTSLQYHAMESGAPITQCVLTGTALDVPGFGQALERELGLPTRPGRLALKEGGWSASGAVPAGLATFEAAA